MAHSCCSGSGCSSLQSARSRNGPNQTRASQCGRGAIAPTRTSGALQFGRGTIAPTVSSGSNWPCSRSWSHGFAQWRRRRRHPMAMGLVHINVMGLVRIRQSRAHISQSRARRCLRPLRYALTMWTAAPSTQAAHPCRAPTSLHSPLLALPFQSRGPLVRSRATRVRLSYHGYHTPDCRPRHPF
jgi:hypothetical protein